MFAELLPTLLLQGGYNTNVVLTGTTLLGIASGTIGAFVLLRKRALMSDALAHAALPGVTTAFLLSVAFGVEPKNAFFFLLGATISGILGVWCVSFLSAHSRISEETAIGIVLSVFFGIGITLLSIIQNLQVGGEGGIHHYIYGQAAALSRADSLVLGGVALFSILLVMSLFKEFQLVCFDAQLASAQGWPVRRIDLLLMAAVVVITMTGLQAVGLILMVALLIVPATAARFWSEQLLAFVCLSAVFGGVSGYVGGAFSATLPRLPAGAIIVLTAGCIFLTSFLFAPRRGLISHFARQTALRFRIIRDHVLRGLYESAHLKQNEQTSALKAFYNLSPLLRFALLSIFQIQGLLVLRRSELRLTARGKNLARKLTRNHRLWEQYLLTYANLPPSHVDPSADAVEHFLSPKIVQELEAALALQGRSISPNAPIPSAHPLQNSQS